MANLPRKERQYQPAKEPQYQPAKGRSQAWFADLVVTFW